MAEIRSKYIGNRTLRRQPVSREEYILGSLERIFPTGHWVETTQDRGEGVSGPTPENYGHSPYVTVIGGQKYDGPAYRRELLARTPFFDEIPTLVAGDGRGAEKEGLERWTDGHTQKIPVKPDRYGKNARKINVEEVLCFAPDSPLLLVGDGERVKKAREWLKRTNSRREVVELP